MEIIKYFVYTKESYENKINELKEKFNNSVSIIEMLNISNEVVKLKNIIDDCNNFRREEFNVFII